MNLALGNAGNTVVYTETVEPVSQGQTDALRELAATGDLAAAAGVNTAGLTGGVAAEDYDGDGVLDLIVSSSDPKTSLRYFAGRGDGTFRDRSGEVIDSGIALFSTLMQLIEQRLVRKRLAECIIASTLRHPETNAEDEILGRVTRCRNRIPRRHDRAQPEGRQSWIGIHKSILELRVVAEHSHDAVVGRHVRNRRRRAELRVQARLVRRY